MRAQNTYVYYLFRALINCLIFLINVRHRDWGEHHRVDDFRGLAQRAARKCQDGPQSGTARGTGKGIQKG